MRIRTSLAVTVDVELLLVGYGHVARRFVDTPRGTTRRAHEPSSASSRAAHGMTARSGRQAHCRPTTLESSAPARECAASRPHGAATPRSSSKPRRSTSTRRAGDRSRAGGVGRRRARDHRQQGSGRIRVSALARRRREGAFLFEGAVMDGVPIFNLVRETLPAVDIVGFRGVVNSTTNYILTAMEQGSRSMTRSPRCRRGHRGSRCVARRRRLGRGRKDRRARQRAARRADDATGTSIARVGPAGRARHGRAGGRAAAEARGASERGAGASTRVSARGAARRRLLAGLEGQQNALVLKTDLLGEIAIVQRGGA